MARPFPALAEARWLNEPPEWGWRDGALELVTGDHTDFWQDTFYGFHRDDGHALCSSVRGGFTAEVAFEGHYETLDDQAGLLVRADARTWIKAGIEHSDGVTNLSVVVTLGRSDWSVVGVPNVTGSQRVRLTRVGDAVIVHHLAASGRWTLLRLADFAAPAEVLVGPMACSPQRAGFRARFTAWHVGAPVANPLHGDRCATSPMRHGWRR